MARPIQERADAAWTAAGLERVTLHACRHLYTSMSIAAGVNAHALCAYMGHAGIQVTIDLYGHLFPGNEAEASALLDAYLRRAFVAG
jgi:integrase